MTVLKVTKHNDLITSRINFTLNEYRIFLYGISLMDPMDENFPLSYEIDISKFASMFNCNLGGLYTELKTEIIKRLHKRSMTVDKGNGWKRHFGLVHYVEYCDKQGIVKIIFDEELKPFVNQLKGHFTSYYIERIAYFKSTYSIRFYEFCVMRLKQNEGKPTQFFLTIQELKERLEIEKKYKLYSDLKRRVILKSFEEINAFSDLSARYEEIKKGRSVHQLKIIVKYKKWEKKEKQYTINFDPKLKV
jgi:plasmid replication initiation protein